MLCQPFGQNLIGIIKTWLMDTAFRQERENKRRTVTSKPAANIKTKFNNFNGRSYDIDSLEERLLKTR